jgi:ABC-2 type transport system permease protein
VTSAPRTGEVFDLGYQRYTGPREGRARARMAIFMDGVRISLGLGRSASQKILPWMFILFAAGPAFTIVILASVASQFGDPSDILDDFGNRTYFEFAFLPLMAFAVTAGPGLLCPDRRESVLTLYLVRPITALDYVGARALAFLAITTVVAYVPQAVIFSTLAMTSSAPATYLAEHWLEVPRFLASGLVIALFTTSLAMAAASLTDRRAVATAGAIGFVLVLAAAAGLLHEVVRSEGPGGVASAARYLELLQLPPTVITLSDWIFGEQVGPLPGVAYLGAVAGFVALFAGVVFARYSRIRS